MRGLTYGVLVPLLMGVAALLAPALGCSLAGTSVSVLGPASKPPDSNAYSRADVQAHFLNQDQHTYVRNEETTFSCVDARGDDTFLSTPGGDFAEFADAIYTFFKQTGVKATAANVRTIFRAFMDKVASRKRPFYYHTDESKLQEVFKAVGAAGIKPKPVIIPAVQPKDKKTADIWYKYLTAPSYQGCGHIRLMMYNPKAYGITSNFVPTELMKAFFDYWWPTSLGSPERAKIVFSVKRGPLAGRAVVVAQNQGPACKGFTPLMRNSLLGSSLFVYHKQAAADFRAKKLAPFFEGLAKSSVFGGKPVRFDKAAFIKSMDALAEEQLAYTVGHLPPADSVPLYVFNYQTKAATSE